MNRSLPLTCDLSCGSKYPARFSGIKPVLSSTVFFFVTLFLIVAFSIPFALQAQDSDSAAVAYRKTATERARKIVDGLKLTDAARYDIVVNNVADQYVALNTIHDQAKAAIKNIRSTSAADQRDAAIKALEEKKSTQLLQQHARFIAQLKRNLSEEQVDAIKDGMTYRVFPITYAAYQDMIPALTAEQKGKIYEWLKEAREMAMDQGSSDDKHKVFGKYKGRINNYLSSAGYDLKKETEDWQQRLREKNEKADK